ncbi:aquaporin-like protein [Bimuria novae-zelandiae CBS 107.79]|uniref:Aquaporin-like protein n=1 Tax=Bimuria novae-zelandiae CBS 107.79 TaxID=1447943 RepID=A0A6A5VEZ3_9PLEO|nr:aquaporin-like protein [Bimuria novae-zelandiae CBS 107.79]
MTHNILPLHKKDGPPRRANGHVPNGRHHHTHSTSEAQRRASRLGISNKWRKELVAASAEFAGTFMFLFLAFGGTQVANSGAAAENIGEGQQSSGNNCICQAPNTSVLLYISLIFGFSLMVNVWVFFRVSGGLFNPAVTLGLYLVGALTSTRATLCFFSQMLAGMAAAGVVSAILPGPLNVSTTLGSGTTIAQGVFLEMFLSSLLVFTIFMLATEKHKSTFLAPIGIGLALFVAELVGVFYTGGSLNPTRSFGPCVVTRSFPGYHYIYWFGPLMGTLLAYGMYRFVKSVEYETVNSGQDFDDHEAALFNPPDDPESKEQVERPNMAAIKAREAIDEAVQKASRSSSESGERLEQFDSIDRRLSVEHRTSPTLVDQPSVGPGSQSLHLQRTGHTGNTIEDG